ncbi:c-type cytochrome [Kordiimonas aestuarii]|uniref:c-type cytochrome n=1 Tax=Kordiimonas aestuarii TaxID=1005925 RepID=UPI0021D3ADCC|nr:cytochrome c [Kordiimonas aestuarii]
MKANKFAAALVAASLTGAAYAQDEEADGGTGQALYEANCAACHQYDGGGVPMMQPELILSEKANGDIGGVIDMILLGSAAVPAGTSGYSNEMPPFDYLSDEDIALIASYVRTHFENSGGAVTADDVRARRASHAGQ